MTDTSLPIIGVSTAMRRVVALAQRFAASTLSVLLIGETGTGKELFAQSIHRWSSRTGEFVDVNCGALPSEMVESLLFGHRRGAFTGAVETVDGFVASADSGTLFLDEVTSLSPEAQAKLLRVLETGEVRPLGGMRKRPVDLRVVAAAQPDLRDRVDQGAFRLDLYQRLAGIVLELPALRARTEDLTPLAEHFASQVGRRLSLESTQLIASHSWPGNARELRLAVERAGWLAREEEISLEAMEESLSLGSSGMGSDERQRVVRACRDTGWDILAAAQLLGVGRTTLYARLREFGISVGDGQSTRSSGRSSNSSERRASSRQQHLPQVNVI